MCIHCSSLIFCIVHFFLYCCSTVEFSALLIDSVTSKRNVEPAFQISTCGISTTSDIQRWCIELNTHASYMTSLARISMSFVGWSVVRGVDTAPQYPSRTLHQPREYEKPVDGAIPSPRLPTKEGYGLRIGKVWRRQRHLGLRNRRLVAR